MGEVKQKGVSRVSLADGGHGTGKRGGRRRRKRVEGDGGFRAGIKGERGTRWGGVLGAPKKATWGRVSGGDGGGGFELGGDGGRATAPSPFPGRGRGATAKTGGGTEGLGEKEGPG